MFDHIIQARAAGKRIGFTCSSFDLLHAGHCDMLSYARSNCDFLVVGLMTDPTLDREDKNKPVETTLERWMRLQSIRYVDCIIPLDTERDLMNLIQMIRPDIRFVGEEYEQMDHTGKYCSTIDYNPRRHDYSTTNLRQRVKDAVL